MYIGIRIRIRILYLSPGGNRFHSRCSVQSRREIRVETRAKEKDIKQENRQYNEMKYKVYNKMIQ